MKTNMKKALFSGVLLVLSNGLAAEESGFSDCHAMSTNYIRLICYDKKTGYSKPEADELEEQEITAEPVPAILKPEPQGKQWRYPVFPK